MNAEIETEAAQLPRKGIHKWDLIVAVQAVSGSIQTRYQKVVPFFRWIGEKYTQTQTQPTPLVLLMMKVHCARIYRPGFHENKPKTLVFT